jgi:hypothetical protein
MEWRGVRWPAFGPEPGGVCVAVLTPEGCFAVKGRDLEGEADEESATGLNKIVLVDMFRA